MNHIFDVLKLRSWWENVDGNVYQVVGNLDPNFKKQVKATEQDKHQVGGEMRRLKTKPQKMPASREQREKNK